MIAIDWLAAWAMKKKIPTSWGSITNRFLNIRSSVNDLALKLKRTWSHIQNPYPGQQKEMCRQTKADDPETWLR